MSEMIMCPRCHGRQKIYTIPGGYSHVNTGGDLVSCPMCLGSGKVKALEDVLKDVESKKKSSKPKKTDEAPPADL